MIGDNSLVDVPHETIFTLYTEPLSLSRHGVSIDGRIVAFILEDTVS